MEHKGGMARRAKDINIGARTSEKRKIQAIYRDEERCG
jgi:hypothetical protein